MADISHFYGCDIDLSANGDFLLVSDESQQHVIKRILTAAGSDLWAQNYGAGLGRYVGSPVSIKAIKSSVFTQIFAEASVSRVPSPSIGVIEEGSSVVLTIKYVSTNTGQSQTVKVPIGS